MEWLFVVCLVLALASWFSGGRINVISALILYIIATLVYCYCIKFIVQCLVEL